MNPVFRRFFLPGLSFCCAGGVFAVVGALQAFRSIRLARRGAWAQATVVEYQTDEEGASYPVVEFVDRLGAMRRVRLSAIMRPSDGGPPVGGALGVLYDPDNPGCVLVESSAHLWRYPLAQLGLGSVLLLVGLLTWAGAFEVE